MKGKACVGGRWGLGSMVRVLLFHSWKQKNQEIYMLSSNAEENKHQEKNKQLNEVHSTIIY